MPEQTEPILNTCPECSGIIDVSAVRPYEKIACPHCGNAVRVRNMFGKFTILAEIGEGGMSRVFRAHDATLGREVALKVLHSHFGDHPELIAQFEKEARLTASINHANVVQVYSVGRDQGYFYIAMELLQNENLDSMLARAQIPEATALRLIHEVTLGLAAAYRHGLIHRDIKPGNILFDRSGTAKLVDFGLALVMGDEEEMADIWATPHYVPPEKLQGLPDDLRGDIYSLGATLFHILAGVPPHQLDTISTSELLQIKTQPANLRAAAPKLRNRTVQLVNRMMAFDPKDRFESYPDLIRAIEQARAEADPTFVMAGRPRKGPVSVLSAVGLGAGLLLLGGIAWLLLPHGTEKVAVDPASSLTGASGEVVVSAEQAARLRALDVARKSYGSGKTADALRAFASVEGDSQLRPDLRAWAAFHLGIEATMKGDAAEAKRLFAAAASHTKTGSANLSQWFASLAEGTASPEDPLAALVLGYQALRAADFPVAASLFERYRGASFAGEESWKALYQEACGPAQADAVLLSKLPPEPGNADPATLQKTLDQWTALVGKLRNETARQFAQGKITALGTAIVQAEVKAQEASRAQDEVLFRETDAKATELAAARDFTGAAKLWSALQPTSDWGRKRATLAADACTRAGQFLSDFTSRVGQHGYSGPVQRTSGAPFEARVVSGTADKLMVDLGFGPTPIALSAISAAGILKIAKSTLLLKAEPEVLERAAFFAWFSGDRVYAKELSRQLHELPGFADRWEAVAVPLPAR